METASKRYVDVTNETKMKLAKLFHCTETFVYMALTYRKNSDKAKKIRYVAVRDFKGKPMRHCPECETMYVTMDGCRRVMVQNFDNGVRLVANLDDGSVMVYNRKDENIGNWDNVDIPKLAEIQLFAECYKYGNN